jgi:hypothetical protein
VARYAFRYKHDDPERAFSLAELMFGLMLFASVEERCWLAVARGMAV